MKLFVATCMSFLVFSACQSTKVPKKAEDFYTVRFTNLSELSDADARRMIDFIGDQGAEHNQARIDIPMADMLKLATIANINTVKFIRANYHNNVPDSRYYAQPTIIVAISNETDTRFFMMNNEDYVCPPPDGSTCLDGLYFK